MTQIVHRAFWDVLQEQLNSDPPNYDHAVILLREVKTVSVSGSRFKGVFSKERGSSQTSGFLNSFKL